MFDVKFINFFVKSFCVTLGINIKYHHFFHFWELITVNNKQNQQQNKINFKPKKKKKMEKWYIDMFLKIQYTLFQNSSDKL